MGGRVDSGVDSVSDIALPFTDESLGEFAFGREPSGRRQITPHEAAIQVAGTTVGALGDTIGAGAEALTPDSLGVGPALQEKVVQGITALNGTEAGSKAIALAMDGVEGWKAFEAKYPQYAKSVGSSANLASIITPSTGATKAVVGGVGNKLTRAGDNIVDGAKDPLKKAIKTEMIGLKNLTGKGRTDRGWRYGEADYTPTEYEDKVISVLADIPGIKPKDPHRSLGLIEDTLKVKNKELDDLLKNTGDAVDIKDVSKLLPIKGPKTGAKGEKKVFEYLNQFGDDGANFATKADAAMFKRVMASARAHLAKTDGSPASINQARKDFDAQYNIKWDEVDGAKDRAVKYARDVLNDAVDEMVPDAKALRADTVGPLLNARESVKRVASVTEPGRAQAMINRMKANPLTPTSILSIGALAGAPWAPWLAGSGLAAMGAWKGAKALKNNAGVRKALGTAVSQAGKAIKKAEKSGASQVAIDQLKADRLLLIDMMQIPQEGDEGEE